MTPEALVTYVRFLADLLLTEQRLAEIINASKKPDPPVQSTTRGVLPVGRSASSAGQKASVAVSPRALKEVIGQAQKLFEPLFKASDEEKEVLNGFGVLHIANRAFFNNVLGKVATDSVAADALWKKTIAELTQFNSKLSQLYNALDVFSIGTVTVPEGNAYIEVVFDGNASIENIVDAREWFDRWYLIIEGYARLLDRRKEDFEFAGLSKASPTKLKIRTTLDDAAKIAGVLALILQIEQGCMERRVVIERMKQVQLVDPESDAEYARKSEEKLSEEVDRKLKALAEDKFNELRATKDGEVSFFIKSVENQHVFIVSGGQVNVNLPANAPPNVQAIVEQLDGEKAKLHEIEERLSMLKKGSSGELK